MHVSSHPVFLLFHIICLCFSFQRVGCDLKIGSAKKVDACGVCGGDGSSCSQPLYHWEMAAMSLCSVTCGGGKFRMEKHLSCLQRAYTRNKHSAPLMPQAHSFQDMLCYFP